MQRRLKTAAPSSRPIASRAEVLAAIVALGAASVADAAPTPRSPEGAPAVPATAAASASASPAAGAPSAPPSSSAAPAAAVGKDGIPIVGQAPTSDQIPVPDLGTGATLSVRNMNPHGKPILYVDGRPVPQSAWASLSIAPGTHEIVMEYPNGEAQLEQRRVSVAPGSTTDLQLGYDPSMMNTGGVAPVEHFGGSGCCGTHAPDQTAQRAAVPAALLAAAIFVARRRRRPPLL